jgi:putative tricarboxylic transport membrane protein
MKKTRRLLSLIRPGAMAVAALFLAASFTCLFPLAAEAQGPKGNIEITVGSGAGGTPDIMMRRLAKILNEEKIVSQTIVVQNRAGGSHTVAANYVLGKKGADNVLLTIAMPIITTPIVQGFPNTYELATPLAVFAQTNILLLTNPDSPFKSLKDLVAAAKKTPRGIKVAGSQVGGTDSMLTGLLETGAGIQLNYIPYDSGGSATASFLGKNVDLLFLTLDEALPLMQTNKVKPLAIMTKERRTEKEFKDIPTAKEQGVDIVYQQIWGIAGPPEMNPALVAWWDDKLKKAVNTKAWKNMAAENFLGTAYYDSKTAPAELKATYEICLKILRDLGISKK